MKQPGHVKIALTSNGLTQVDTGFSTAKQVLFYDIGYSTAEFLDCVSFKGGAGARKGSAKNGGGCWMEEIGAEETDGVDPLTARVEALKGCGVLFTKTLSDPAAVRVHALKVFPVKMEISRDIDEVITSLQKMMNSSTPPLWLRKAMNTHIRDAAYQIMSEEMADEG